MRWEKFKPRPSGAKTWTQCTSQVAYLRENADILPDDGSSEYANEGNEAHSCAQRILLGEDRREVFLGKPQAFIDAVMVYVSHCRELTNSAPCETHGVEEDVRTPYDDSLSGTVDFWVLSGDTLYIRDLKFGMGVSVSAIKNKQLTIYALGLLNELELLGHEIRYVSLGIIQPRIIHGEKQSFWMTSVEDLRSFYDAEIGEPANLIYEGSPETKFCVDDEVCQFCPARGFCKARKGYVIDALANAGVLEDGYEDDLVLTEKKAGSFDDEALKNLLLNASKITKFLKDAEEFVKGQLELGVDIPGIYLVEGRQGALQWSTEEEAEKYLSRHLKKDERYKSSIITPTQAKELLIAKGVSDRIMSGMGDITSRKSPGVKLGFDENEIGRLRRSVDDMFGE